MNKTKYIEDSNPYELVGDLGYKFVFEYHFPKDFFLRYNVQKHGRKYLFKLPSKSRSELNLKLMDERKVLRELGDVEGVVNIYKFFLDPIFAIVKPAVYGRRIYYDYKNNLVKGLKETDKKSSLVRLVDAIHERNVSGLNLLSGNLIVNSNKFYITDIDSAKIFGKDIYPRKRFDKSVENDFSEVDLLFGGNKRF